MTRLGTRTTTLSRGEIHAGRLHATLRQLEIDKRDCLETALSIYLGEGKALPVPSEPERGQVLVAVSPAVAAQFALYEAMHGQGVSAVELVRRIGPRSSHAKRLIDICRPAKPDEIRRALAAVGLQMTSDAVPLEQWTPSHDPAPAL